MTRGQKREKTALKVERTSDLHKVYRSSNEYVCTVCVCVCVCVSYFKGEILLPGTTLMVRPGWVRVRWTEVA